MRILIFLVLIGAAAAGSWVWLNRDRSGEIAAAEASVKWQKAALGMRTLLREHEVYEFGSIVLGSYDAEGAMDFRGQVARSGRMTPAYGKIRPTCEDELDQKSCWELVYLEADGQEVDLGGVSAETPETGAGTGTGEAGTETAAAPDQTDQGSETQAEATTTEAIPATTQTAAESGTTTGTEAETAAAQPTAETATTGTAESQAEPASPPATHQVARPVINTRSGPGTGNPVVTRLTQGAQLALLEEQGGWGRFIVLDGEARGTEVWAALSILEAL